MDFSTLKNQSKNSYQDLQAKLAEKNKSSFQEDPRFIKFERDAKTGTGKAIIRFLPAPPGEDLPYINLYKHSFEGPGGWFIENCPRSIDRFARCPVCEANKPLWDGTDADKVIARKRNGQQRTIANIFVVKNPMAPETEGQVRLFDFGKQIKKFIDQIMADDEVTERKALNPFDLWNGRNFLLSITTMDKYPSYTSSTWMDSSNSILLGNDDAKLEKLWKSQHPLRPFLDPSQFKSYDELLKQFNRAVGGPAQSKTSVSFAGDASFASTTTTSVMDQAKSQPKFNAATKANEAPFTPNTGSSDADELARMLEDN
jgi:hypothetical protein